jgi:hypothetical protein
MAARAQTHRLPLVRKQAFAEPAHHGQGGAHLRDCGFECESNYPPPETIRELESSQAVSKFRS